jgi:hypothetical protein
VEELWKILDKYSRTSECKEVALGFSIMNIVSILALSCVYNAIVFKVRKYIIERSINLH